MICWGSGAISYSVQSSRLSDQGSSEWINCCYELAVPDSIAESPQCLGAFKVKPGDGQEVMWYC